MKRYLYLLLAAILFCGMGGTTSCSVNEDNPTSEELFTATGVTSSICSLTS